MPDSVPGFVHLHAPLTVLAPGLLLMLAVPGLLLLPRAKRAISWCLLAVAVFLVALIVRSALLLEAHWAMLPGGWVHAGTIAVGVAACAAGAGWRQHQAGARLPVGAIGAGYLMVTWSLPVAFAIALDSAGWRRWVVVAGLCCGGFLCWALEPSWGQAVAALTVMAVAPRWRIQAGLAAAVALAAAVFTEHLP
jgi:hypothetical protein